MRSARALSRILPLLLQSMLPCAASLPVANRLRRNCGQAQRLVRACSSSHEPLLRLPRPVTLTKRYPTPSRQVHALARLVAARLPDTRALQNGGVGDQLSDRLQRIEDGQGRLVELAIAEYIKQNEGSVRAAAIREYSKANQHDQAFVAAAATEYMEAHKDDEYFFGKAVDAYIAANKDSEELRDAAAEKYKGEMRENMRGDGRRT